MAIVREQGLFRLFGENRLICGVGTKCETTVEEIKKFVITIAFVVWSLGGFSKRDLVFPKGYL